MPINREQRDAAADALASFMRGELDRRGLEASLLTIFDAQATASDRDDYLEEFINGVFPWVTAPFSEDHWQTLCRQLAFLKGNLEKRDFGLAKRGDSGRPREILLARWHALTLGVAAACSLFINWWVFAVACVISFIVFQIWWGRHNRNDDELRLAEMRRLLAFHPFANEQEWLAHEGVLGKFCLPAYDPALYNQPIPQTWRSRLLTRAAIVVQAVMIVCMILWMYASSVMIWPIWLIAMSVNKRNAGTVAENGCE